MTLELAQYPLFTAPALATPDSAEDNLVQAWPCNYSLAAPGVKAATNATVRLGPDVVPQPDGLLRSCPRSGLG